MWQSTAKHKNWGLRISNLYASNKKRLKIPHIQPLSHKYQFNRFIRLCNSVCYAQT